MSFDALANVRVLDLGIITAGASTTAILADLGAEVIKVEGPGYTDPFRVWTSSSTAHGWWNNSPHFAFTNRNKKSLCIDIKSDDGRQVFLDLVRHSDIVVENFRVGVLDGLGLGFEALVARNPRIVLASISSQGATGPDARSVSFGSTLEASSGFASLVRDKRGVPQISGHALNYPDQVVSLFAAGAIVSALMGTRRTGVGAKLDISQRELTVFMLGEMFDDEHRPKDGPGASAFLNTLVRCGDGRWLAITLRGEADARSVAGLLGIAGLPSERALGEWAAGRETVEAEALLRRAGAAAATVRRAADLVGPGAPSEGADSIAFDVEGKPAKGLPWRMGGRQIALERPVPGLGEDNESVVVGIAGRSRAEYQRLVEAGVLATEPRDAGRGAP